MKLRQYQNELAAKAQQIIEQFKIVYLALEMRVGKTAIALEVAKRIGAKSVLFVTKKKAISSIEKDYKGFGYKFKIHITNYESLSKLRPDYDLIIVDEAHSLGAFPKPSQRARQLQHLASSKVLAKVILLSGTPTPESYSQLYHQLYISYFSPFNQWPDFYKWAKSGFVDIYQMRVNTGIMVNNYSRANKPAIDKYTKQLFLTYTQKQANFVNTELTDSVVKIPISPKIQELVNILIKDRYYKTRHGSEIVCDTAVKLKNKIHQIYSGTVIDEDGMRMVLDTSKVDYISKHYYMKKKLAIFYLFQAEGDILRKNFYYWTEDPDTFNKYADDKQIVFISQFQAGSRGIDLSAADVIIFYNIHFSSELYQQARQRAQMKDKTDKTELVWLFSNNGIEQLIYDRVIKKQTYTLSYFSQDFL